MLNTFRYDQDAARIITIAYRLHYRGKFSFQYAEGFF